MPNYNNTVHPRPHRLSLEEIRDGCVTISQGDKLETRICIAQEELRQGIDTISLYPKSVTMYGSARLGPGTEYYELARSIASRIVTELGYAVITGGGPGIMEAANRGAIEAGGESIGLTIKLPHEQSTNLYVNVEVPFYYFFTRKTTMSFSSLCYLAFPGGFGTFDEIFEIITLMQTGKIPRIPIVLVGHRFWDPLVVAIKNVLYHEFKTVSASDMRLFIITDDINVIMDTVRNAPERSEYNLDVENESADFAE